MSQKYVTLLLNALLLHRSHYLSMIMKINILRNITNALEIKYLINSSRLIFILLCWEFLESQMFLSLDFKRSTINNHIFPEAKQ